MNLPVCIHCDHAPDRREHDGRAMFICPVCNARGEAATCETWAAATWRQVNREDLPSHACGHRPRFKSREGKWWACCTGCQHMTGGFMSLEGAVAGWMRSLR